MNVPVVVYAALLVLTWISFLIVDLSYEKQRELPQSSKSPLKIMKQMAWVVSSFLTDEK